MRCSIAPLLIALLVAPAPAVAASLHFPNCGDGKRITCVVDGDTFWLGGEKLRLAAIDAPEMGKPKCGGPARQAKAARDYLRGLLDGAELAIRREGRDRYGRTLASVSAGGVDVGAALLAAGLARPYVPGAAAWCR